MRNLTPHPIESYRMGVDVTPTITTIGPTTVSAFNYGPNPPPASTHVFTPTYSPTSPSLSQQGIAYSHSPHYPPPRQTDSPHYSPQSPGHR